MKINVEKLKNFCDQYTVTVSFNGFTPFTQEVIDVNKLFDVIHEVADVDKTEFTKNVNNFEYNSPELESIFRNVKFQGKVRINGFDALSGDAYIERKSLNWLKNEG